MISHDTDAALKYASHVLHIGQKNFFGDVKEYDRYLSNIL